MIASHLQDKMDCTAIPLDIAVSFDQGYVPFVYALLASIFQQNTNSTITIHALAPEVLVADQDALKTFVTKKGGSIVFYELDTTIIQEFALPTHQTSYFTLANYYRLFFADLVPQHLEKLLYLDIDTLVVGNLGSLFQIELGDFAVGAVLDTEMHLRADLGLATKSDYFNSGVLLINLPQWRQQHVTERACDIALRYPEKVQGWVDQDALNMLFQGVWYRLDWRYNVMNGYIPYDLPRRNYQQFLADKAIIHFTGTPKAWHWACDNKLRFLYADYAQQIPQAILQRYIPKKLSWQALRQLTYKRALEAYFNYPEIGQAWRKIKATFRR